MFRRLILIWENFTPVEKEILSEIEKLLPPETKDKFRKQVKSINKVQRLLDWTEINFYRMKAGKVQWDSNIQFTNTCKELRVAKIEFSIKNKSFQSTLHAVQGHIFSLVTRPSIKSCAWDKIETVTKIDLLNDPEKIDLEIQKFYYLPPTYLEWLEKYGAISINGWNIHDKDEVDLVNLKDGDYLVLADRAGDEYLLAKAEGKDDRIYYIIHDNDKIDCLNENFSERIESKRSKK